MKTYEVTFLQVVTHQQAIAQYHNQNHDNLEPVKIKEGEIVGICVNDSLDENTDSPTLIQRIEEEEEYDVGL
jgi:hypothetical protein